MAHSVLKYYLHCRGTIVKRNKLGTIAKYFSTRINAVQNFKKTFFQKRFVWSLVVIQHIMSLIKKTTSNSNKTWNVEFFVHCKNISFHFSLASAFFRQGMVWGHWPVLAVFLVLQGYQTVVKFWKVTFVVIVNIFCFMSHCCANFKNNFSIQRFLRSVLAEFCNDQKCSFLLW